MIELAKKNLGEKAEFLVADLQEPLDLPDASFDLVVSALSIDSLQDFTLFFRECGRVLKPGGRLVFLAYEMATRRRANPKIEATVHMVGIMALLVVMVLVTYKDIAKLF